MKSDDRKKLLLSDTAVPDVFISEYMPALTGLAVQAYIYIRMVAGKGFVVGEKEIASRLSMTPEDIKGALAELSLSGLIDRDDRGKIRVTDIKAIEVDRYILRSGGRDETAENEPISPLNEAREELARSIEKTFFHGSMAYKWYREIDLLLFEFGFDPDVVYALFQSLFESNQLTVVSRMKSQAVEWHAKGIRTAKELGEYIEREEKISSVLRRIGKRLRKKMTEFDEDYIRIWIEKLGYSYEMIEFAIQRVCEYSTVPSMKRANEHLYAWFGAGVKTLDEAKFFEENQAKINAARYREAKSDIKPGNSSGGQNFSGVSYSEDELRHFEDDPRELMDRYARNKAGSASDQED